MVHFKRAVIGWGIIAAMIVCGLCLNLKKKKLERKYLYKIHENRIKLMK